MKEKLLELLSLINDFELDKQKIDRVKNLICYFYEAKIQGKVPLEKREYIDTLIFECANKIRTLNNRRKMEGLMKNKKPTQLERATIDIAIMQEFDKSIESDLDSVLEIINCYIARPYDDYVDPLDSKAVKAYKTNKILKIKKILNLIKNKLTRR